MSASVLLSRASGILRVLSRKLRYLSKVGKVFDTDKNIVSYDDLGIARLIYHLPTTLCETFLKKYSRRAL